MLVLRDGTIIYDEYSLLEVLEPIGFDCWKHQKLDLYNILTSGDVLSDDPVSEVEALKNDIEILQSDIADLEDQADDLCNCQAELDHAERSLEDKQKVIDVLETLLRHYIGVCDDASIEPFDANKSEAELAGRAEILDNKIRERMKNGVAVGQYS